ncbi:hypothetical protein AXF42_Ash011890 [Apostasia shenzhenica]|uniref:Uncharacterized protein n=1 Tax=Apostasia shenzhenica TaxID=1088818 RepID=A0A2I0AW72_9ASPA|nr:hypothetical protein AXF42_Ash011890 [Apostasia shenzhenica]
MGATMKSPKDTWSIAVNYLEEVKIAQQPEAIQRKSNEKGFNPPPKKIIKLNFDAVIDKMQK